MNLDVIHNRRRVSVMEPFTLKGKPRCQAVTPANSWYPHQCERAATYFEPHRDRVFLYPEDVLFGYCSQHSMTKNHREQDAKDARRQRTLEARVEATRRLNLRDKLFSELMHALVNGEDPDVDEAQEQLEKEGFRLTDFRLER